MLKQRKTIYIIAGVAVLIVAVFGIRAFLNRNNTPYVIASVEKGSIIQQVSATGQVKKGEEIDLGFENSGISRAAGKSRASRFISRKARFVARLGRVNLGFSLGKLD